MYSAVSCWVRGVGGDHRPGQAHGIQQFPDLGDLVRFVRDAVPGDDHAVPVEHRGEQLDLAVRDAAGDSADEGSRARETDTGGLLFRA